MRIALLLVVLFAPGLAQATEGTASAAPGPDAVPATVCLPALAAAERAESIPTNLLRSIALVESGRLDPATGRVVPWPWAINAAGQGQYFETREQAIAAVRALQAAGVRSIDVGCAQINLMHHPLAFSSLDTAFDPATNAAYAARFLRALHGALGNWPRATAAYHSHSPEFGPAYAQRVMAVWPDAARFGPWPSVRSTAVVTTDTIVRPANYRLYTPEFAARLRAMNQDRTARLAPARARAASAGPVWINRPPTPVMLRPPAARGGAPRELRQAATPRSRDARLGTQDVNRRGGA